MLKACIASGSPGDDSLMVALRAEAASDPSWTTSTPSQPRNSDMTPAICAFRTFLPAMFPMDISRTNNMTVILFIANMTGMPGFC
jgi:hypothetical protein